MNMPHSAERWRSHLGALVLTLATALAACEEQPSPSDVTPQLSTPGAVTVRFVVKNPSNHPVQHATVTVYLNDQTAPEDCRANPVALTNRNCWIQTNASGIAEITVPSNASFGYLARLLPPEWLNFATSFIPPTDPGTITPVANNLGALTCGNSGPVAFTPGTLNACVNNRYALADNDLVEVVDLVLPIVPTRTVTIRGPNGQGLANGLGYVLTKLDDPFDWQGNLGLNVKAGFLWFFGQANANGQLVIPQVPGDIEVYGVSSNGFEIAGTLPQNSTDTNIPTSPVICANPTQQSIEYSFTRAATNNEFSIVDARWAYAARRGTAQPLTKDLGVSVAVLKFQQSGGPHTVQIRQRHRDQGTDNATVTVSCTNGVCNVANAVYSTPGAHNPVLPHLYQPQPGKLFWVVRNLSQTADSEWSVKVFKTISGKQVQLDQLPDPSKSTATSAFFLFSKGFTFCDPDFSFDGVWGCEV